MTKEMLKEKIREVSIAKTYEEYVDALAEHLTVDVAKEIFEEIGKLINEYLQGKIYTHDFCTRLAELKKKYTEEGKMIIAIRTNQSETREETEFLKKEMLAEYMEEIQGKSFSFITESNESGYGIDVILEVAESEDTE